MIWMSITRRLQLAAVCIAMSIMAAVAGLHVRQQTELDQHIVISRVLLGTAAFAVFAAIIAGIGSQRFSTRTLLIITSIMAIVLGLIVWATR